MRVVCIQGRKNMGTGEYKHSGTGYRWILNISMHFYG